MNQIPHNASRLFVTYRNDELVRQVLFLKLAKTGFELDSADRRDIINRMMEPLGAHRMKEFIASQVSRHTL